MSTVIQNAPSRKPAGYPFHIGRRYHTYINANNQTVTEEIPLTEEDYVHPQEEDHFMTTQRHHDTIRYLQHAISINCKSHPHLQVFTEQIIDWQNEEISPHGPDLAVFDPIDPGHDPGTGTVHVKDLRAKVVTLIEVTSESTRHKDFGDKFDEYEQLGVPYYVVIDLASPHGGPRLLAFRHVDGHYREMKEFDKLGYMIPPLKLWIRLEGDRTICADEDCKDIPDPETLKELMDQANLRADAEKQRADALAAEVAALKAQIQNQTPKE